MIALSPTGSYKIDLPDDMKEERDSRISSFWRPGSHCALQLSSNSRGQGEQTSAEQRLRELMERDPGQWLRLLEFRSAESPDSAAAVVKKEDGWVWTHIYLVWPDLAIYATISKPPYETDDCDRWR